MFERSSVRWRPDAARRYADRLRAFLVPVCILTGAYILAMSAILRANYSYIDDIDRAATGNRGWGYFGRHLSNILSVVLHTDTYLTDISPLPQLAACLILAAASVIVLYLITGRDRYTVWEYAAVFPLGLGPFMLECLAFKFDAPYMALSVLVSVAPLLLENAPPYLLGLGSFAGAMAMCTSYQASAGIFPMLTVLLALRRWQQGRDIKSILRFIAAAAAGYCAALLLFMLLLGHPTGKGYVDTAIPSAGQLIPHTAKTMGTFFRTFLRLYDKKWLVLSGLLCLGFVWTSVRDTTRSRPAALALTLAAAAVMALLSFGTYPLLSRPLIEPRSMYGISVCISLWAVSAAAAKKAAPYKLICLVLAWCFAVFAFSVGNALYDQKVYTEFRIDEVIDSFKQLDQDIFSGDTPVTLQIKGDIGKAPVLRGAIKRQPLLGVLVPSTLGERIWNSYGFMKYYGLPKMTVITNDPEMDLTAHLPLLDETLYHALYGNASLLVIELK